LRFLASLFNQPVDVLIGETSNHDPRPRLAAARDRLVELDRDRDVITRVKAPAHQLGSDVTNGVSITSLCDDMTLAPRPRLDGASIRRQRIPLQPSSIGGHFVPGDC